MPYRDRIEVVFDAGHRLLNYVGKCASPHGHTFRAEIILEGETLNDLGLLVDFSDIKRDCSFLNIFVRHSTWNL